MTCIFPLCSLLSFQECQVTMKACTSFMTWNHWAVLNPEKHTIKRIIIAWQRHSPTGANSFSRATMRALTQHTICHWKHLDFFFSSFRGCIQCLLETNHGSGSFEAMLSAHTPALNFQCYRAHDNTIVERWRAWVAPLALQNPDFRVIFFIGLVYSVVTIKLWYQQAIVKKWIDTRDEQPAVYNCLQVSVQARMLTKALLLYYCLSQAIKWEGVLGGATQFHKSHV